MCGILLIHSKNKVLSRNNCINSAKDLFKRGPDSFKYEFFNNSSLFISNTVLSITGKDKNKKKLTRSDNNRFIITFNGEIYNYQNINNNKKYDYKKDTDTKILVDMYENFTNKNIPKMLNGMFAYIIYDQSKKILQIVNDPQGEKNLYYFNDKNYFIVASKISTITKFLGKYDLNVNSIKNYFLTRHYMPNQNTCFKGIKIFNSSSINYYSLKSKKLKNKIIDNPINWITKKNYSKFKNMEEDQVIDYFERQIINQLKLMIPDRKFGCIVSGGIDSTLQAKLINNISNPSINVALDYGSKDPIMKNLDKFNQFFKKKIKKKKSKYKFI